MSASADSAEQIVKVTMDGAEVALKLTGSLAKELAALLVAILKDKKDSPGKKRVSEMVRKYEGLSFLEIRNSDLPAFVKQAKNYGITYAVMSEKKSDPNAMIDLLVRPEDAARIERITEKFKFSTVTVGELEAKQSEQTQAEPPEEPQTDVQKKDAKDLLLDEMNEKPEAKENTPENPFATGTSPERPSEPSSPASEPEPRSEAQNDRVEKLRGEPSDEKPSVRERLTELREKQEAAKIDANVDLTQKLPEPKLPDHNR